MLSVCYNFFNLYHLAEDYIISKSYSCFKTTIYVDKTYIIHSILNLKFNPLKVKIQSYALSLKDKVPISKALYTNIYCLFTAILLLFYC